MRNKYRLDMHVIAVYLKQLYIYIYIYRSLYCEFKKKKKKTKQSKLLVSTIYIYIYIYIRSISEIVKYSCKIYIPHNPLNALDYHRTSCHVTCVQNKDNYNSRTWTEKQKK